MPNVVILALAEQNTCIFKHGYKSVFSICSIVKCYFLHAVEVLFYFRKQNWGTWLLSWLFPAVDGVLQSAPRWTADKTGFNLDTDFCQFLSS